LTENRIQLIFSQALPPVQRAEPGRVDEIYFGDTLKARIWIYVDAIMDPLRDNPAVRFVTIEATLHAAKRQTAGPEKRPLADALRAEVEARLGKPGG